MGVAAVALTWPYARLFGDVILGDGSDVPLSARQFWALDFQGGNPFTTARDFLLAAPDGVEVPRATNLANILFTGPVWVLGALIGYAEAFNAYAFAALVLSGTAAFVLIDRLGYGVLAAAFGAYVFAFNPNHLDKVFGHAPLAATGILPLVVLALLASRRRPTAARAVGCGLLLAVAFYLNSYLGLFALFAAVVFGLVDIVLRAEGRSLYEVVRSYYFLTLSLLLGLIPLGVSWYFDPSTVSTLAGARSEVFPGGAAEPQLYLLPGPRQPWLGGPMSDWLETHLSWEYTMFFGYTTIALALAGVVLAFVRQRRRGLTQETRFVVVFAVALTLVGVWASLPTKVHVSGFDVPTPSYFIREATTLYRVFSRFGVLVGLGLVILAAYALSSVPWRRYRAAAAAAALALVAFELYAGPPQVVGVQNLQTPVTVRDLAHSASSRPVLMDVSDPPAYLEWLRRQPPGVVVDYPGPLAPDDRWAWKDVFYQQFHQHALWRAADTTRRRRAPFDELVADLDEPRASHVLALGDVRYVVLHADRYRRSPGERRPVAPCGLERLAAFPGDDVLVYEVDAELDRGFAAREDGFHSVPNREIWPENRGFRWMAEKSEVLLYSPREDDVFLSGEAVSLGRPRVLRVFDSAGARVGAWEIGVFESAFRFALHVRPGVNRFFFVATPGAVRSGDDRRPRAVAVSSLEVAPIDGGPAPAACG